MINIRDILNKRPPRNGDFYTIAIDGRGGSGKSVLADHLAKLMPAFVVINGDDYFEPVQNEVVWGDFNEERFNHDVIQPLQVGNRFAYRPYDWHAEPHVTERTVSVAGGFCLERCFSFALDLDWDFKLWVETPRALCLERGVARESIPKERAMAAWRDVWQPREDEYINREQPTEVADVVVDGTEPFDQQITA
jgi:uridine kinase